MIATTLNAIRKHKPCQDGWKKLLRHLGKTSADDKPLPLLTILDSNGLDDTLWCFQALDPKYENWIRLTICDLVQPVMKYITDPRPQKALDVARAYARGEATKKQLKAAGAAAMAAGFSAWAAAEIARTTDAANTGPATALQAGRDEQERILRTALKESE